MAPLLTNELDFRKPELVSKPGNMSGQKWETIKRLGVKGRN
jgi:hypothetical protein